MSYHRVTAMMLVRDLRETMEFYTEVLGFQVVAVFPEDDPAWCRMVAGDADIMFSYIPPHDHDDGDEPHSHDPEFNGMLYFYPRDLDALYERVKNAADVAMPLQSMPYGMREFHVYDPNGYALAFGGEPA